MRTLVILVLGTMAASGACPDDPFCDDVGCPEERPICYDQPGGYCVECVDDGDCGPGEHCDTPNVSEGSGDCLVDGEGEGEGE